MTSGKYLFFLGMKTEVDFKSKKVRQMFFTPGGSS